jgi:predicted PurR-regulated permease PerM
MSTVIGVWAMGQFLDGYLITPKIQGDKTGLGYAGVIFSFFFWGLVFQSLLGLLLAIPLSAFCIVLWNALKERYIRPVL